MKQSLKGICPEVCEMTPWPKFIQSVDSSAQLYIAHCMNEMERKLLSRELHEGSDVVIAIGPEGDFSPEEVRQATEIGFVPVSLGDARLRTETAALMACQTIHVVNQLEI